MRKKFILLCMSALIIPALKANSATDSAKIYFENAYAELKSMLEGRQPVDFEKAVFISENAYWANKFKFESFKNIIDNHLSLVKDIIQANDRSDKMDFSVKAAANGRFKADDIRYTEKEKKEMYHKAISNWAIFTYITDTFRFYAYSHLPFSYASDDPFGKKDWRNSQVLNLLTSKKGKGNCFALTGLFKILSDRLNSGAKICTAPQHIYIQHQDPKGDFYNVELATAGHPGDGVIQTLTYTTNEAIMHGIALRDYSDKQSIGLCMVNLAKGYEHSFSTGNGEFLLKCAETVLKHDSLNLNALLLKQQVLDERVCSFAIKNKINNIKMLKADKRISGTLTNLEKHTAKLYDLGYRQMPLYMQQMILNGFSDDKTGSVYAAKNPSPFTTVKPKDENDEQYWTLSHGAFQEVFEHKKIETFGHFTYNTDARILESIDTMKQKNFLIDPVAFAYDFGERMYDARTGLFISVDPMAKKFPGWSPYASFADNPISNTDVEGKEPARNQAGTIQASIAQLRELKLTTAKDIMHYIQTDKNAIRYVYTEKNGWIDLQHYYGTIVYGKTAMDLLEPASGSKILQKTVFGEGADKSYYSYEDLPSNKFGSEAPVYDVTQKWNAAEKAPEPVVTEKTGEDLYKAVEGQFQSAGATSPQNAPNWKQIPLDDQERSRLPDNSSPQDLSSGNYVPQNHTDKPYDLKNFPAAKSSLEKTEDKK